MTDNEKAAKLEALLGNESFVEALKDVGGKEELQTLFERNGLPMSRNEIDALVDVAAQEDTDEIDTEALEGVTGGVDALWIFKTSITVISKVAKTCWNAGKTFANWGF